MNKKWIKISTLCILFGVLAFAGCVEPVRYPEIVGEVPSLVIAARYRIVGTSVQNRPIMCLELGNGSDATFIMATIHGNEAAGTPLVRRLAWYLREHSEILTGRKVVLMAVANPDGMINGTRHNVKGVDLNRNFQAANRVNSKETGLTALSEPETRIINQLIRQYAPARIVSIHNRLQDSPGSIDYDGPGQGLASHMVRYCDLSIYRYGALSGSLGAYAGVTLGIPTITFELARNANEFSSDTLWKLYGKALIAAIVYPDTVK
jgi:protein MpaA